MIKNKIKLSSEFKKQTTKAILSILLFLVVYLLIILAAIALTAACVFGGITLIISYPRFITLMLGIGLASLGVIILFFLLKFIFKSYKIDRSQLHEITKDEEPKLFGLINEIVNSVGTQFPKKVYLSTDVNASVFYNSSFFSMFFPVKKNLQIGLGLVNSVSTTELKAILAHEFGHFSQRTMKVGSYVYNVNQVIHNLVYEDETFNNLMLKWANISGYFSLFVVIAIKIIHAIQWILRKMYEVVNISYMGLSREMEFHADEIAANVAGSEPLQTSLARLSIAGQAYDSVLNFYSEKINDNIKSENIYQEHGWLMRFIAVESGVKVKNDLPSVTIDDLKKFNKSKLVVKDQWASHPSIEERLERLGKLNVPIIENKSSSANELFTNINAIHKQITNDLFKEVTYSSETSFLPLKEFERTFKEKHQEETFDKIFNGYYDNKNPIPFEVKAIETSPVASNWEELVSIDKVNLTYAYLSLQSDIEELNQIANKQFKVKSYDYDGRRYKPKETYDLIKKLNHELDEKKELIRQNDIEIFKFLKQIELSSNHDQLSKLYNRFFLFEKKANKLSECYYKIVAATQFVNFTTPFEQIKQNFRDVKMIENDLKNQIRVIITDEDFKPEVSSDIKEVFDKYLKREYQYFGNEVYFDENLEILFSAAHCYNYVISNSFFSFKKKLLNYKKELISKA